MLDDAWGEAPVAKRITFPDTADRELSVAEHFARCDAQQKRIKSIPYRERVQRILKHLLFLQPLFRTEPLGGYKPFETEMFENRFPFDFSVAPPAHLRSSQLEWRYRKFLELLNKLPEMELRWLLVSRWLQQEKICKPEDFLPTKSLKQLIKRFGKRFPWSPAVLYHKALIDCWRPYFARLLGDFHKAPKTHRGEKEWLMKQGYDCDAIECAIGKKSSVQATSEWVERRTGIKSRTLENDYSKGPKESSRRRSNRT
jgi:hypothetical protein